MGKWVLATVTALAVLAGDVAALADGEWEITRDSERASTLGLRWLAANQGRGGNWGSNDLGLVSVGALAFLSAGHAPGRGRYGENVRRALDFVLSNAKPSGLLNVSSAKRDMYNHGLSTFVLTQAYGMTSDPRVGRVLDRSLKVISNAQCEDGGWDYEARRQRRGHDLSLAVMQAKALRGAMDIGFEIDPRTIQMAIKSVREHYKPTGKRRGRATSIADIPGQFTYSGNRTTTAMAAAGVVCLQEFGQYDDFRIRNSMDAVIRDIDKKMRKNKGRVPFDAYTLYYVGQALYQVGGGRWRKNYPKIRDAIIQTQRTTGDEDDAGSWDAGSHVSGRAGRLFGTSVAVFVLNIPNRYLPILQQAVLDPRKATARRPSGETADPKRQTAGERREANAKRQTKRPADAGVPRTGAMSLADHRRSPRPSVWCLLVGACSLLGICSLSFAASALKGAAR